MVETNKIVEELEDKLKDFNLKINNTQNTYDEHRFSIKQGSFMYDTFRY